VTIDDVLKLISKAHSLSIETSSGFQYCAVCYKRTTRIISIHEPRGQVIPLCAPHLAEVEPAAQEAMKRERKQPKRQP
jgi:hypothetical protein